VGKDLQLDVGLRADRRHLLQGQFPGEVQPFHPLRLPKFGSGGAGDVGLGRQVQFAAGIDRPHQGQGARVGNNVRGDRQRTQDLKETTEVVLIAGMEKGIEREVEPSPVLLHQVTGPGQVVKAQAAGASTQAEAVDTGVDSVGAIGQGSLEFLQVAGRRQQFGDAQEGLLGKIGTMLPQKA